MRNIWDIEEKIQDREEEKERIGMMSEEFIMNLYNVDSKSEAIAAIDEELERLRTERELAIEREEQEAEEKDYFWYGY
jgi:uncharacterized small protein (DUF1192 family)